MKTEGYTKCRRKHDISEYLLPEDSESPHSRLQCCGFQIKCFCSTAVATYAPPGSFQYAVNMIPLNLYCRVFGRSDRADHGRQFSLEGGSIVSDQMTFNHVAKFPHISGPGVALKRIHRRRSYGFYFPSHTPAQVSQEVPSEHGNVLPAFPQRRNVDREDIQSIIQILAKLALPHCRLQIAARGNNQARIHANGLGTPKPFELTFLKDPQ